VSLAKLTFVVSILGEVATVVLDEKGSSIFGERQNFGVAIHFYQPNIFG